jgi:protoheme IX farnesyltransferase
MVRSGLGCEDAADAHAPHACWKDEAKPCGFSLGMVLSAAGFAELWFGTNRLAAALGLFTLLIYLLAYTPLKRRFAACTTVGAIPGAMPPLIGYAAAAGAIDIGALALFLVLFTWQFPHFDSIAWMYREDYARGGIRMLPVIEPDGESTARRVVVCSLLLIPISLLPSFLGMTGSVYGVAAIAAGLGLLYFGARLGRERTPSSRAGPPARISSIPASVARRYGPGPVRFCLCVLMVGVLFAPFRNLIHTDMPA